MMLETRPTDDITLRCKALLDRVDATPIGRNAHALKVAFAECDTLERAIKSPWAICRLRDVRHWFRLAYGNALHGYPPDQLRKNLRDAIEEFAAAARPKS